MALDMDLDAALDARSRAETAAGEVGDLLARSPAAAGGKGLTYRAAADSSDVHGDPIARAGMRAGSHQEAQRIARVQEAACPAPESSRCELLPSVEHAISAGAVAIVAQRPAIALVLVSVQTRRQELPVRLGVAA